MITNIGPLADHHSLHQNGPIWSRKKPRIETRFCAIGSIFRVLGPDPSPIAAAEGGRCVVFDSRPVALRLAFEVK